LSNRAAGARLPIGSAPFTVRRMRAASWLPVLIVGLFLACSSSDETRTNETPTTREPAKAPTKAAGPTRPSAETEAEEAPPQSARTLAAPALGTAPKAPAIGQWVRYGVSYREGGRSTVEYRIVDREGDSWWLEITDRRRENVRHVRMRVRPRPDGTKELLALAFKNGNEVEDIPTRLLGNYAPMLGQWLDTMLRTEISGPQEDVTVAAGTFQGSFKGEQTMRFLQAEITADVWWHPEVPLTAMVKLVDRAQGGHTLELLGFGDEGATSAF
jgi:hypothetical protein